MVIEEAEFDAERWYALLEREHVTVWYTAPTAIRLLMRAGADLAREYDLSLLLTAPSVQYRITTADGETQISLKLIETETTLFDVKDKVAWITLNRPGATPPTAVPTSGRSACCCTR